jgi:hypothetical protein
MLTADQVALYKKDMYVAQREAMIQVAPKVPDIFKMLPTQKGAGDKETQLLGAGRLTRHTTEGQDILFKSPVQGWTTYVKYHTYSAGIALTKEAVEDTTKGGNLLKDLAAGWGKYGTIAKEELGARVFNKGGDTTPGDWVFNGSWLDETDSSGGLLYDSIPLFALTGAPHTTKGGTTYFNSVASLTMIPSNFETLYNLQTATNNRDEEDEVVGNPVDTILCQPGSNVFLAERIVDTSRGIPGQQLNDKNPYYKIIDKIIGWDYLASTAGIFVGKRNHEKFCFCDRQSQETDFYRHQPNKGYRASVDMRFGVWLKAGSWRAWVRGGGTSTAGGG